MTPAQRVDRIFSEAVGRDLDSWEKHQFLPSIKERQTLTEKQEHLRKEPEERSFGLLTGRGWPSWPVEPDVGRVADGVAARVDRLKAIGNGQVPRVATAAFKLLSDR